MTMEKVNIICAVIVLLIEAEYFLLRKWRIYKWHRPFPEWKTKIVILIAVISPLLNLIYN